MVSREIQVITSSYPYEYHLYRRSFGRQEVSFVSQLDQIIQISVIWAEHCYFWDSWRYISRHLHHRAETCWIFATLTCSVAHSSCRVRFWQHENLSKLTDPTSGVSKSVDRLFPIKWPQTAWMPDLVRLKFLSIAREGYWFVSKKQELSDENQFWLSKSYFLVESKALVPWKTFQKGFWWYL